MTPWLDDGDVRLFLGDCVEVMAAMPAESVDAVVCDPPYGLEFMGKDWDAPWKDTRTDKRGVIDPAAWGGQQDGNGGTPYSRSRIRTAAAHYGGDPASVNAAFAAWCETWAREALRVLKPGGHLLAFGGTRTYHRLTCGIEDAGFEVRDCLSWLYGSGFPKSLDVSKAIDKKRDDRDDIARVVDWLEARRRESGVTRREVEDHFGTQNIGQALFTVTPGSTPRGATWDQWEQLRRLLGFGSEMDSEVWRLNGRKGEPGEAWHEREVTGLHEHGNPIGIYEEKVGGGKGRTANERRDIPATDSAREWQGWGTALKPAWEPCVVARKPLAGTVAENVQRYGTGAINVDGCRIGTDTITSSGWTGMDARRRAHGTRPEDYGGGDRVPTEHTGRWPANVALDEAAAAMLDAASGTSTAGAPRDRRGKGGIWSPSADGIPAGPQYGDTGGASRFYYTAKASRADRNTSGATNTHPTVKPTDLMRWLVRLVTPPGGVVLDPFAGSGSTLVAARAEGFRAIGIEREQEYADIIAARLSQLSLFTEGME